MVGRSKVEKSTHFNEILGMIKEGFSSYNISNYLKVEYDESISPTAISNYVKKIKKKTSEKYYQQKKVPKPVQEKIDRENAENEVVRKGVNDLTAMDNIIQEANDIKIDFDNVVPEQHTDYVVTTPLDIVNSQMKYKGLAIQAVNAKARILKEDTGPDKEFIIKIVSESHENGRVESDKKTT